MEGASSKNKYGEQDTSVVQLVVTEEQGSVIEAVFGHYNWNYQEVEKAAWRF